MQCCSDPAMPGSTQACSYWKAFWDALHEAQGTMWYQRSNWGQVYIRNVPESPSHLSSSIYVLSFLVVLLKNHIKYKKIHFNISVSETNLNRWNFIPSNLLLPFPISSLLFTQTSHYWAHHTTRDFPPFYLYCTMMNSQPPWLLFFFYLFL